MCLALVLVVLVVVVVVIWKNKKEEVVVCKGNSFIRLLHYYTHTQTHFLIRWYILCQGN